MTVVAPGADDADVAGLPLSACRPAVRLVLLVRAAARLVAVAMLDVDDADAAREVGRMVVKGVPDAGPDSLWAGMWCCASGNATASSHRMFHTSCMLPCDGEWCSRHGEAGTRTQGENVRELQYEWQYERPRQ